MSSLDVKPDTDRVSNYHSPCVVSFLQVLQIQTAVSLIKLI